ncbi:MAG TPA: ABC transporter substrate-binding protein, partial [Clostridia bacterium]|nr:ABC transporter substrate-binding protein [Clostridia bacterium]
MKKNSKANVLAVLMVLLFVCSIFSGCSTKQGVDPTGNETGVAPTVVTTSAETEAAKTEPPRKMHRIICLAPSMVEVVYALGAGEEIVGWSKFVDYPPEVTQIEGWIPYEEYEFISNEEELKKQVAVVSEFQSYNAELVDLLEPTIILSEANIQKPMTEELSAKGYEAHNFEPKSLEDVYEMIIQVGELLGREQRAEELVNFYRDEIAKIENVTKDLPKVKVYLEISHQVEYDDVKYGPYA